MQLFSLQYLERALNYGWLYALGRAFKAVKSGNTSTLHLKNLCDNGEGPSLEIDEGFLHGIIWLKNSEGRL